MNARELTQKIHQQLRDDPRDEESWLRLLNELQEFSRTATESEREELRRICYGGEMFVMIATGIEYERQKNND